jgi:hypothetical protein
MESIWAAWHVGMRSASLVGGTLVGGLFRHVAERLAERSSLQPVAQLLLALAEDRSANPPRYFGGTVGGRSAGLFGDRHGETRCSGRAPSLPPPNARLG